MPYDIYGNPLAAGHCEVHPYVAAPWPCWECYAEDQYRRDMERRQQEEYYRAAGAEEGNGHG